MILKESLSRLESDRRGRITAVFDAIVYSKAWDDCKEEEKIQIIKSFLNMSWVDCTSTHWIYGEKVVIETQSDDKVTPISVVLKRGIAERLKREKELLPNLSKMVTKVIEGAEKGNEDDISLLFSSRSLSS